MKKDLDAVEMKRKGQEALRARLAGMTREEQVEFWRRGHLELLEEQRQLREQQQQKRSA
jgi:hypothetical protein